MPAVLTSQQYRDLFVGRRLLDPAQRAWVDDTLQQLLEVCDDQAAVDELVIKLRYT